MQARAKIGANPKPLTLIMDNPIEDNGHLFGNNFSFFGRPLSRHIEPAEMVILGIPFDMATSGRAGARHGPEGVRAASGNLRWEEPRWPWDFAVFERMLTIDYGDLRCATGDLHAFDKEISQTAHKICSAGKRFLGIGGDHYVTLPLLRGAAKHHGELALLHFDAHSDTWAPDSVIWNHGSMFWQAPKEGLIDPKASVQVGIRTQCDSEEMGFTVLYADMVNDQPVNETLATIRKSIGDRPVYITFDIDCLDPAFAPGTGTPVVGGLSTDRALTILRGLVGLNIVAMDVTEVSPAYDHAQITALAAATLAYEMLHVVAARM